MTVPKTIEAGNVVYACPHYDVMRPLTPDERAELKEDIRLNGIVYPVIVTEDNEVIDGHNRLEIAVEIGMSTIPVQVMTGLTPHQKRQRAEDLNIHRRHLTRQQRQKIIAVRLKTKPGSSDRAIAEATKSDHKTVGKIRSQLESTGEIPQLAVK